MIPASNNRSTSFASGTLLRDKYRVARLLGQGGMGIVVEAVHLDLERRVAIKILHPELQGNRELVERFVREGRAASRIEGDHVARVFDVDRLEDGTPFLVMEYLEGKDLSHVRRNQAPLPTKQAIGYVLQACSGVARAHAGGVIHRDVKPANLFVTADASGAERVKVLDFGISKLSGPGGSEPNVTRTTIVMGSVEYMSPEQMLSTRDVDVRTDVWALGVVLFELLTATAPFGGENTTQICAHVMSQSPVRPKSLRADLPDALEAIIMRCLEKERDKRYSTVDELAAALRDFLATTPLEDYAQSLQIPPRGLPGLGSSSDLALVPSQPPCDRSSQAEDGLHPRIASPTALLPNVQRAEDTGNQLAPMSQMSAAHRPPASPGSITNVGVASDPVSELPRHRSPRGLYAVICAVLLVTMGMWALTRPPAPTNHPVSVATHGGAESESAAPSAYDERPTVTMGLAGPASTTAAPSALPSAGTPQLTSKPDSTASARSTAVVATSKPAGKPRTVNTGFTPSGID